MKYGLGVLATTLSFALHKAGIRKVARFEPGGKKLLRHYSEAADQAC